jgi:hypothetical protein
VPKRTANASTGHIMAPEHLWAVLLAGGDGIRLRDLTRRIAGDSRPKQFCPILSGKIHERSTDHVEAAEQIDQRVRTPTSIPQEFSPPPRPVSLGAEAEGYRWCIMSLSQAA